MATPTSVGRGAGDRRRSPTPIALILAITIAISAHPAADAEVFGECARATSAEAKIAACTAAARSTAYPWILRWVYRELGDAYRERGELEKAIASYQRSLAMERILRQAEDALAFAGSSH
jgi:hypothetical protein